MAIRGRRAWNTGSRHSHHRLPVTNGHMISLGGERKSNANSPAIEQKRQIRPGFRSRRSIFLSAGRCQEPPARGYHGRTVGEGKFGDLCPSGLIALSCNLAISVALAMPPLLHIVCTACRPPASSSARKRLAVSLAPDARTVWPRAIAPPSVFTRPVGAPGSRCQPRTTLAKWCTTTCKSGDHSQTRAMRRRARPSDQPPLRRKIAHGKTPARARDWCALAGCAQSPAPPRRNQIIPSSASGNMRGDDRAGKEPRKKRGGLLALAGNGRKLFLSPETGRGGRSRPTGSRGGFDAHRDPPPFTPSGRAWSSRTRDAPAPRRR